VEFDNSFTVAAPVDEVYSALLDLERVTPAMPGASVLSKEGDDAYKVAIKVKLGPVTMNYRGDVTVVDRDPAAHTAVLDVKAKEARGQGSANAVVRMSLSEQGSETAGTMKASVQLSGKAAAMSRGVIDDVSRRLVTTFAENLEGILGSPAPESESEPAPDGEAAAPQQTPPPSPAKPGNAERHQPEAEALDVGNLAASMAADRLKDPKVLGAALGGALLAGYLLGRRS
jgi:carbon monoxide dehydrogenase subunit G